MAPGHIGGSTTAECDPAAWQAFLADYLRLEQPTLEMCYRNLQRLAAREGWTIPCSPAALKRRLERELHPNAVTLAREGAEALSKRRPPQIRDRSQRAMWGVNADGHVMDNFVKWPGLKDPVRPVFVAWQDICQPKILSWRLGLTENSDAYRCRLPICCATTASRGTCSWTTAGRSRRRG